MYTTSHTATSSDLASILPLVVTPLRGPRRTGEWSPAEIAYAYFLSNTFKEGLLEDVQEGKSVRLWLGAMLNCSPMRLSKKFPKESELLGMSFFQRNQAGLDSLTLADRRDILAKMDSMRAKVERSSMRASAGLQADRLAELVIHNTHHAINANANGVHSKPRRASRKSQQKCLCHHGSKNDNIFTQHTFDDMMDMDEPGYHAGELTQIECNPVMLTDADIEWIESLTSFMAHGPDEELCSQVLGYELRESIVEMIEF
ncbi:unnamed protein product [Aphanomyces euteiches]